MVYLDNAATSYRKPHSVYKASIAAMKNCASAGRGGYPACELAEEILFACRSELATLYGMESPERIAFTSNATVGLNMAIKGCVTSGNHVVTTGYEHNAVMRPLTALSRYNVTVSSANTPLYDVQAAVRGIDSLLTKDTRLVVVNHVSNVFGFIQPLSQIDELCAYHGIPLIIDASQSAGLVPIDVSKLRAAVYICMPGHKSLYGPHGTGVVIACPALDTISHTTVLEGGTGSDSSSYIQPTYLPDMLESGTHNVCGIAGLLEGVRFVRKTGVNKIRKHGTRLCSYIARELSKIEGMKVFFSNDESVQLGVLSFVPPNIDCTHMAAILAAGGFCVRAGHHCAPLAHKNAGTHKTGTVRVSPSYFTTENDVERFCTAVRLIVANHGDVGDDFETVRQKNQKNP